MTASKKIGILGLWTDPIAQLLEDVPEYANAHFFELRNPEADIEHMDSVFVVSQQEAIAHLNSILQTTRPITILMRRHNGSPDKFLEWENGITLLGMGLNTENSAHIRLAALSDLAAAAIGEMLNKDVTTLQKPHTIVGDLPKVVIERDVPICSFSTVIPGKPRETRKIDITTMNWARLRRLARPIVLKSDDEDMADLVAFSVGTPTNQVVRQTDGETTVVVVVPNGVGLGHITRMMGIGHALKNSFNINMVFWSYSRAVEILRAAGFKVILRQNAVHLKTHPPSWRKWETKEFARTLQALDARIVFYDGGTFDKFLVDALASPGCGKTGVVWVRRGMMRPDADPQMLEAEQYCDLVIEPGDLASEVDIGPTRKKRPNLQGFAEHIECEPVTLRPYLPAYTSREAKKKLKMGMGRHILISLGGAFGNWVELRRMIATAASKRRIKIVWAKSPLAPPLLVQDPNITERRFYPLNRYLAAFDGVITATGYNSFHELLIGYDKPIMFVPTNNVRLDDQVARAQYAESKGWAHVVLVDEIETQGAIIEDFMDQVRSRTRNTKRPEVNSPDKTLSEPISKIFQRYQKFRI